MYLRKTLLLHYQEQSIRKGIFKQQGKVKNIIFISAQHRWKEPATTTMSCDNKFTMSQISRLNYISLRIVNDNKERSMKNNKKKWSEKVRENLCR